MRILASVLFLCLLFVAAPCQAQLPTATISGIVKDSQGARVQGARVLVVSTTQGTSRTGATNADGSYSIPDLLPGDYRVNVSSAGFATAQYANVSLEAGA